MKFHASDEARLLAAYARANPYVVTSCDGTYLGAFACRRSAVAYARKGKGREVTLRGSAGVLFLSGAA